MTDWLYHHLAVTGDAAEVTAFRAAAAGAGIIPWVLDLERMEEDLFLKMAGAGRSLSLEGARMLAGELREAVGRRHAAAAARVGRSRACPFDLHTLLPVPELVLRLGPDDPAALAWLWETWGTTAPLRHVEVAPGKDAAFRVRFWAADWTPWRALVTLQGAWPALRFEMRPIYELA